MYDAETSMMDAWDEQQNAWAPLATMADAHREWHRNAGVPMGQPGCPQDACHPIDDPFDFTDMSDTPATPWEPPALVTCGHCKNRVWISEVRLHFRLFVYGGK